MKPKTRGWHEGILSISLTNGFGVTLEKGSIVRYRRFKSLRDKDGFKLTMYEWHYLNEDNQNLVRTSSRTIEGLPLIKEEYIFRKNESK